jgi:hypothetical protein
MGNSNSSPPGDQQSRLASETAAHENTRSSKRKRGLALEAQVDLLSDKLMEARDALMEAQLNEEVCSVFVLVVSKVLLFFRS